MDVAAIAAEYRKHGLACFPVRRDGSKAPQISDWPNIRSDDPRGLHWWDHKAPPGIGINNKESGGLEQIDFDRRSEELFPAWNFSIESQRPRLLESIPVVKTPNGYHVYFRSEYAEGNQHLALNEENKTLIETRGVGGYVVAPGSPPECHPDGKIYNHLFGPPIWEAPLISKEDRECLLREARCFDCRFSDPDTFQTPTALVNGNLRPGDDFNDRGFDWQQILVGWTLVRTMADGSRMWRRPGKDKGCSATTDFCKSKIRNHGLFKVFSSNAAPFEVGKCYSKFSAFGLLHHQGNWEAAARDLRNRGFGSEAIFEKIVVEQIASSGGNGNGHDPDWNLVIVKSEPVEYLLRAPAWKDVEHLEDGYLKLNSKQLRRWSLIADAALDQAHVLVDDTLKSWAKKDGPLEKLLVGAKRIDVPPESKRRLYVLGVLYRYLTMARPVPDSGKFPVSGRPTKIKDDAIVFKLANLKKELRQDDIDHKDMMGGLKYAGATQDWIDGTRWWKFNKEKFSELGKITEEVKNE